MLSGRLSHANFLISFGTVGAFPQVTGVQLFCDFSDCPVLSGLYLFSRSCAQLEPLNGADDLALSLNRRFPHKKGRSFSGLRVTTIDDVISENFTNQEIVMSELFVACRLIGNIVVDFLFVLIELFSLGVTAEAPRALSLTVFTQRNSVADFLQAKCTFRRKTAILRF